MAWLTCFGCIAFRFTVQVGCSRFKHTPVLVRSTAAAASDIITGVVNVLGVGPWWGWLLCGATARRSLPTRRLTIRNIKGRIHTGFKWD